MTHAGGRPSKLTGGMADRLVAALESGATLHDAAAVAGIADRTVRAWRERAWSKQPTDRPYVDLERRVQRALGRADHARSKPEHWTAVAARLAADNPSVWGSLDDLIDLDFEVLDG